MTMVIGKLQQHGTDRTESNVCTGSGQLHYDDRPEICRDEVGAIVACPVCQRGVVVQPVTNAEAYRR